MKSKHYGVFSKEVSNISWELQLSEMQHNLEIVAAEEKQLMQNKQKAFCQI